MLGGIFAGLIAPLLFSWVAEYPVLAVLAVLCRPKVQIQDRIPKNIPQSWFWIIFLAVASTLVGFSYLGVRFTSFGFVMMILSLLTISVMLVNYPIHSAALVGLTFVLIRIYPINEGRSENVRSFFGVLKSLETSDGRFRITLMRTTIHGAQRLLSDDGKPLTGRPEPLTYYHKKSAMPAAIAAVPD